MFDISFGELLLIGGVALVVLGPERLPEVARTVGALVARARGFVASVKADIGQQANLDDLALLRQDVQATARHFTDQLASEVRDLQTPILAEPTIDPAMPAPVSAPLEQPAHDDSQLDLFQELLPPQQPLAAAHPSPDDSSSR